MLTEEEVKKLEEQNELQRRFDAANNKRIANMDMRGVNREQARNDAWHEANMRARRRRLESRAEIAMADPGRFSPFERNALIDWRNRNEPERLREHEIAMLQQQGKNEFAVAEQKRLGMREQGRDAAEWGFKGEEVKAKTGLTQAELDATAKTRIAELDTEAKKYGADRGLEASKSQHGYFDEKGVYHPGGNVAVAEASGKAALEVEHIRGQATVDAARAQAEAQRLREQERQAAMLERKLVGQDEAQRKNIMAEANKLVASAAANGETLSLDAAVDQVLAGRAKAGGQQQGGQAPKEGQTRKLSSGKTAVFRNGKWQLAE